MAYIYIPTALLLNGNADGGIVANYTVPTDCKNIIVFTHAYSYNGTWFPMGTQKVLTTKGNVTNVFYNTVSEPCSSTATYVVTDCAGATLTIYSGGASNVYARYSVGKLS